MKTEILRALRAAIDLFPERDKRMSLCEHVKNYCDSKYTGKWGVSLFEGTNQGAIFVTYFDKCWFTCHYNPDDLEFTVWKSTS